jgi:hypothetical protein
MSDYSRRAASFDVSTTLITEALRLPERTCIFGVEWQFESDTLRLYVTHPDFSEVPTGVRVPHMSPVIYVTRDEAGGETYEWQWKPEKAA